MEKVNGSMKKIQHFVFDDEFRAIYKDRNNIKLAILQTIPRVVAFIFLLCLLISKWALWLFAITIVALMKCFDMLLCPGKFLSGIGCILDYVFVFGLILAYISVHL